MTGTQKHSSSESAAPRSRDEIYAESLQRLAQLQLVKAQVHAEELALVLAIRDTADCALIPGATPGSIRPHKIGDRGDRWVELEDIAAADIATAIAVGDRQARALVHTAVRSRSTTRM